MPQMKCVKCALHGVGRFCTACGGRLRELTAGELEEGAESSRQADKAMRDALNRSEFWSASRSTVRPAVKPDEE